MTPTLEGRLQTRIFLALTVGVLWTAIIAPFLPEPAGVVASIWTVGMRYTMAFVSLLLMTVYGLVWEHLYHRLQQRRWDRDWPSVFGLLTILNEAPLVWLLNHLFFPVMSGPTPDMLKLHNGGIAGPLPGMLDPVPDMMGPLDTSGWGLWASPFLPAFAIHITTTWLIMWLFSQGPMRVLFIRWRFEGGRVVHSRLMDAPPDDGGPETPVLDHNGSAAAVPSGAGVRLTSHSPAGGARPNGNLTAAAPDGEMLEGSMCGHGHFGPPGVRYCITCGRPLPPQPDGTRALGPRPPLGVLIFDDGATHVLDGHVTLARAEEPGRLTAAGPRAEVPAAFVLAEIRPAGWQPIVSSELHRIELALSGGEHVRVEPGDSARLVSGIEFTVATHRIRYESPYRAPDPDMAAHDPHTEAVPKTAAATAMATTTPSRPGAASVQQTVRD